MTISKLLLILAGALLTAAWMWPSEGAIQGDGLHLALLWLVFPALALLTDWKCVGRPQGRAGWMPSTAAWAVILLCGGFWLSTWNVFQEHGDRRAALNLALEWSALAAVWWSTRRLCADSGGQQYLGLLLVVLGAGMATLGICQHHVIHPGQVEWYQQQRTRLGDVNGGSDVATSWNRAAVEAEFQRLQIPTSGPARQLFERRLLDSSEPTGPFALANSLGGFLGVVLILLTGSILSRKTQGSLSAATWIAAGVTLLLVGYCLVLTKSRTAWVGCLAGAVVLFLQYRRGHTATRIRRMVLAGALVAGGIIAAAIGTGAIDREVLSESPRSLQFRLLYWVGAADVIKQVPVFGAGPGNFRQLYLQYKAPESSEEILDPHNFLVDSWVSGGLAGLLGMILLLWSVYQAFRRHNAEPRQLIDHPRRRIRVSALFWGLCGGAILHFLWQWFAVGDLADTADEGMLAWGGGVWLIPLTAVVLVRFLAPVAQLSAPTAIAAFVALSIHLLGAGGLQISGVVMLLLVLHAVATGAARAADSAAPAVSVAVRHRFFSRWGRRSMAGLLLLAAVACFSDGVAPVLQSQQQLRLAAYRNSVGNRSGAIEAAEKAVSSDPIDVESCQRKLELLAYEFQRAADRYALEASESGKSLIRLQQCYESGIAAANKLIDADRRSWPGYHFRGHLSLRLGDVLKDERLTGAAVRDFEQASRMYPTNSQLLAELAETYAAVGNSDQARSAAGRALVQDQINHEWGHADRYLNEATLARIVSIRDAAASE
ncbi:MAG: O-antigen ligase family protein [Fuerstiella sp.]